MATMHQSHRIRNHKNDIVQYKSSILEEEGTEEVGCMLAWKRKQRQMLG